MTVFKRATLVTLAVAFAVAGCDSAQAPAAAAPKTYNEKLHDCLVATLKSDAHSRHIDRMILQQKDGIKETWRLLPLETPFGDEELGGSNTLTASMYVEKSTASPQATTPKEIEIEATHYDYFFERTGRATLRVAIVDSDKGPVIAEKFNATMTAPPGDDGIRSQRMLALAEQALVKTRMCIR